MSDYRTYIPNSPDGTFFNYGKQPGLPSNPSTQQPPVTPQQLQEFLGGLPPGYLAGQGGPNTNQAAEPSGTAVQATAQPGSGLLGALTGRPGAISSVGNAAKNPTGENVAAAIQSMLGLAAGMVGGPVGLITALPAIASMLGLRGPTSGTVAPGQNSTNNAKADLSRIVTPPTTEPNPAAPGAGGPGTTGPGTTGPGATGPGTAGPTAAPSDAGPAGSPGAAAAAAASAAAAAGAPSAAPSATPSAAPSSAPAAAPSSAPADAAPAGTGPSATSAPGPSAPGAATASEASDASTAAPGPAGPGSAGPGSEGAGPGEGDDGGASSARGGRINYRRFAKKDPRPIWHVDQSPEYQKFAGGGRPIKKPRNNNFEGIWDNPRTIAEDAARNTAAEDPAMKQLWGYDRDALYEAYKDRTGNMPGESFLRPQKGVARGSEHTVNMMTPGNARRLQDILAEGEHHAPDLSKGMQVWYAMDPVHRRLTELHGDDMADDLYRRFNTMTGMASPGSEVMTELNRGTAANTLARQGRFGDFEKFAGLPEGPERSGMPPDMQSIQGHPYHPTAQAGPMRRFVDSDEVDMSKPKVPLYIGTSSVPSLGFQSDTPVPDSHFSRGVGLADVRTAKAYPSSSMTMPELRTMAPWFRREVADPLGIQAVPAQARLWGTLGHLTGVGTPVGAPKLELLSKHIMKRAYEEGVEPREMRDAIISGERFRRGGLV